MSERIEFEGGDKVFGGVSLDKPLNQQWRFQDPKEVSRVVDSHADEIEALQSVDPITDAANGINNNNGVAELGTNPLNKNTTIDLETFLLKLRGFEDLSGIGFIQSELELSIDKFSIVREKIREEDLPIVQFEHIKNETINEKNNIKFSQTTFNEDGDLLTFKGFLFDNDTYFQGIIDGLDSLGVSLDGDNYEIFNRINKTGARFNDRAKDEANVDFATDDNNFLSIGKAKENLEPIATPQVPVSTTPQAITTAFKSTTQNVFNVGALCVFNVTTGCLNVGQKFGVNIGDSAGMDFIAGAGTNVIGVITGSTTVFDTVMIERITDGSFNLTGEVYKVM